MDRYSVCINEMNQGEAISVFTLMILEIAIQKMKISSISKTTDMSDIARTEKFAIMSFKFVRYRTQSTDRYTPARTLQKQKSHNILMLQLLSTCGGDAGNRTPDTADMSRML